MKAKAVAVFCGVILIGSPLSAKDLPRRKAEAPRRTTGCEFVGPGYAKLPGTDTCVKISGTVRAEGMFLSR